MAIVMPLLTAIFVVLGIAGGYMIAAGVMGVDGSSYISNLNVAVTWREDVLGCFLKSFIFGLLAGLISTYKGVTSAPNSAGVSAATTATVVVGSVCVLVFDFFITALWGY
jgi:phospholipid/cholesterol/gamma-HCH transport system permease protein